MTSHLYSLRQFQRQNCVKLSNLYLYQFKSFSSKIGVLDGSLDTNTVLVNRKAMQSSIALLRDALKDATAGGGKKATDNHIKVSSFYGVALAY